ncbi:MAG: helix-turn-helix domain-containing protein [Candidatus Nanoarchaeia archaeon]|nr:helix-turn-helix domain-containing protein [Candidatus Nanoarchaeia archaeon]MDD5741003.1 helix-turn-helix domain-containing protein [Candidatus Nanoarchaeia archaeon]
MDTKPLREAGLSDGEIKVYLAMLKLGLVSAGPIIRETKLQSSSVYHIFDSLLEKGIISYEVKNKRKYFYAVSPERLLDFVEEKKKKLEEEGKQIEKIMAELSAIREIAKKPEQETLIFVGWKGVFSAFKEAYKQLTPGVITYAYTITKEFGGADPKQVRWLISKVIQMRKDLNKRYKQKTVMKIISEKGSEIGKDQAKTKFTEVRFIEKHYTNPAVINIYGNITIIAIWLKNPIAFYITSREVADSFRNNFEMMWKIAKK